MEVGRPNVQSGVEELFYGFLSRVGVMMQLCACLQATMCNWVSAYSS